MRIKLHLIFQNFLETDQSYTKTSIFEKENLQAWRDFYNHFRSDIYINLLKDGQKLTYMNQDDDGVASSTAITIRNDVQNLLKLLMETNKPRNVYIYHANLSRDICEFLDMIETYICSDVITEVKIDDKNPKDYYQLLLKTFNIYYLMHMVDLFPWLTPSQIEILQDHSINKRTIKKDFKSGVIVLYPEFKEMYKKIGIIDSRYKIHVHYLANVGLKPLLRWPQQSSSWHFYSWWLGML
ncbi:hypothetical protein PTTG_12588, partial [Puccinia triticina 1-1 BBBD Race 1]